MDEPSTSGTFRRFDTNTRKRKWPYDNSDDDLFEKSEEKSPEEDIFPTFEKPQGSGHLYGPEFQYTMCALYSLKFCNDKRILDFEITSNNAKYKVFDDIVMNVTLKEGKKLTFLMQLKHGSPQKKLTLGDFARQALKNKSFLKNHYCLKTHLDFIKTIKSDNVVCIIFTNNTTSLEENSVINFEKENVTVRKCDNFEFIDTLVNTEKTKKDDILFLETNLIGCKTKFYLFSNQDNVQGVKLTVAKVLQKVVEGDLYDSFDYFMRAWWSSNFILRKSDIIAKLVELFLTPFIETISEEKRNSNVEKLKKIFNFFPLVLVEPSEELLVAKIWAEADLVHKKNEITSEFALMGLISNYRNYNWTLFCLAALKFGLTPYSIPSVEQNNLSILDKYQIITNLSDLQMTKIFWYLDLVPLIVQFTPENKNLIKRCLHLLKFHPIKRRIVFVGHLTEEEIQKIREDFDIFLNLSDLFDSRFGGLNESIFENFSVQFQDGGGVSLKTLLNFDESFASSFGVRELLEMSQSLGVTTKNDNLLEFYLSRSISTTFLDTQKLIAFCADRDNTQLIVNCESLDSPSISTMELSKYIKSRKNLKKTILVQNKCTKGQFDDVCQISGKSVYLVQVFDNRSCLVLSKKGDSLPLEDLGFCPNVIDEGNILETFDYNVNFVCGPVGIGKSTLLSYLRQQGSPGFWSVLVYLPNHMTFLQSGPKYEDSLFHFLKTDNISNTLEKKVKDNFLKARRIFFFLDGLDEIEEESRSLVLNFIERVATEGAHVWVSGRESLENEVTEILKVPPLRLEKLNKMQQKDYLYSKLDGNCTRIFKSLEIANADDLLGNPLYLTIIAQETWAMDQQIIPVNQICQILFDRLLTFLNKENLVREDLEVASLKSCLDDEDFELLELERPGYTKFDLGKTLALYFSALWFSKNVPKIKLLVERFFLQKFYNLRTIFDVILAADDQNFLQIIYKNFDNVENVSIKDGGGRSILHLLCSYGTHYPINTASLSREDKSYTHLLGELLLQNDAFGVDLLFRMTPLEYATRCGCLYVVEKFLEKFGKLEDILFEIYDTKILAFYCCQMGYHNLLRVIINRDQNIVNKDLLRQAVIGARDEDYSVPRDGNIEVLKFLLTQIDIKERNKLAGDLLQLAYERNCYDMIKPLSTLTQMDDGNTILHVAAKYGKFDQNLQHAIRDFDVNAKNIEGETPLHIASQKGHLETVKYLLDQGASPNSVTNKGRSVLHYPVSKNAHLKVIELLLQSGADSNIPDNSGLTCLKLAEEAGNSTLVDLLKHESRLSGAFEEKLTIKDDPAVERMEVEDSVLRGRKTSGSYKVFSKRPGTVNRGQDYENLLTAYLVLTLVTKKEVQDFRISMDDAAFGNFDDIVIHLRTTSSDHVYALQVKHSERPASVTKKRLSETRGDFSLMKYFKSSQELLAQRENISFIVFTNRRFDLCDGDKIELEGGNCILKCRESEPNYFLESSTSSSCFGFDVEGDSQCNDFFRKFTLYGHQSNYKEMILLLQKEFSEKFSSDSQETFMSFIQKWRSREGKVEMLDKTWMQRVITLCVLTPFIKPLSSGFVDGKIELLRDAVWAFDVTMIEEGSCDCFSKMWMDMDMDEMEVNRLLKKYQLSSVGDLDRSKLLWVANKAPLIVKSNDCVEKILKLGWYFKFILIGSLCLDESVLAFSNLGDLKRHLEIYNDIVKKFCISIQGREKISLESLIDINNEFEELFTTNVLSSMTEGPYEVGGGKEILPEPYMVRCLSEIIIDGKYLDNVDENTIVLLSACEQASSSLKTPSTTNIFSSESESTSEDFEKLCASKKAALFHHFKFRNSGNYEWLESKGGIKDLTPFRIDSSFLEEKYFFSTPQNKLNIVSADPGMGKSCFLRNLKNHIDPKFWAVLFASMDLLQLYSDSKSGESLEDYIMGCKYTNLESFERKILTLLLSSKKIVFLWDALDEVSVANLENVVDVIRKLRDRGFIQWITCRTYLKNYCEERFSSFCREMQPLQKRQIVSYLQHRDVSLQKIENFLNHEILSVPLCLHLFAEVISTKDIFNQKILSLVDLYEYFIEEKFDLYYKHKVNIELNNEMVKKIFDHHKKTAIKNFELAALKALDLDGLGTSIDQYLKELEEDNDPLGLITRVENNTPYFVHQVFAEYFAALFLYQNHRDIPNLGNILFDGKYTGLRLMFDFFMAKNSVGHIAILSKTYELIESLQDEINTKDPGGRSLLHIASSWGSSYPPLEVQLLNNSFMVCDSHNTEVKPEAAYVKVLEYLLERCDPSELDHLFEMTPLAYAVKTNNLLARLKIMKKEMKTLSVFDDDAVNMLYYSVKYGWSDIFAIVKNMPVIIDAHKNSLLHLAIRKGNREILAHLLEFDTCKSVVNDKNGEGRTPLSCAVDRGRGEMIKLLVENGADVNA